MSRKILLIDNNEFSRLYLQDAFWIHPGANGEFYEAVPVKTIEEAQNFLKDEIPEAIMIEPSVAENSVTERITSWLSACEFIKKVRSYDKTANIPIIAFSEHNNDDLRSEITEAGATAYMIKGKQTADELVIMVDSILALTHV